MVSRLCSEPGCSRPGSARGWCRRHYQHYWKLGLEPLTKRYSEPVGDRFWAKVQPPNEQGCWEWTAATHPDGYGNFSISHGLVVPAHRFVYELLVGPIPADLTIDHVCHNSDPDCPGGAACNHRRCVNPSHLEAVPNKVNVLRGLSNAALNNKKTHCIKGHPFDAENTSIDVRGSRCCLTCGRERALRYRTAKRDSSTTP